MSRTQLPREPPPPPPTWESLEATKVRAAHQMDRVEYLFAAKTGLIDMNVTQAKEMWTAARSKSASAVHMKSLSETKHKDAAFAVIESQRAMRGEAKTRHKRLGAVAKYIVDSEFRKSGQEWADAAKRYSRGSTAIEEDYPSAQDLLTKKHGPGHPVMAVYCSMPYTPPEKALMHGMRKSGRLSNSTGNFRSQISGNEENDGE